MILFLHLVESDTAEARIGLIRQIAQSARVAPMIFAALDAESRYAPTDWLSGPGCNCCLPAAHPRTRLMQLGLTLSAPRRVVIDAGQPVLANRLASILRAMPFRICLNIITA